LRAPYGSATPRSSPALPDDRRRRERYEQLIAQHYESGKAVNAAMVFEIDDVIDPADTRRWVGDVVGGWRGPEGPGRS
jgi:acetyl-CoA carboxylase carboxyltransferase component